MKKLCGVVVFIGTLSALPATAGEYGKGQSGGQTGGQYGDIQPGTGGTTPLYTGQYANSSGFANIWSGAQGTSNSYGQAKAVGMSSATSQGSAGGGLVPGSFSYVGGITSGTTSFAKTMRMAMVTLSRRPQFMPAALPTAAQGMAGTRT